MIIRPALVVACGQCARPSGLCCKSRPGLHLTAADVRHEIALIEAEPGYTGMQLHTGVGQTAAVVVPE